MTNPYQPIALAACLVCASLTAAAKPAVSSPAAVARVNPQPLPPVRATALPGPGARIAVNPQPLPPRTDPPGSRRIDINPQPLPPRD